MGNGTSDVIECIGKLINLEKLHILLPDTNKLQMAEVKIMFSLINALK